LDVALSTLEATRSKEQDLVVHHKQVSLHTDPSSSVVWQANP